MGLRVHKKDGGKVTLQVLSGGTPGNVIAEVTVMADALNVDDPVAAALSVAEDMAFIGLDLIHDLPPKGST